MRIRYLHIKNFRGIREARMEFPKQESVLCLIGAGDTTKTTILKAIEYALWPSWNLQVTTSDFYNCNLEEAIVIEVSVEDIPETLLRESKYGLYLRGSVLEEDDEPTEDEAFLTIQLTIDNSLEPIWNAISNGKDSKNISQADRQLMSVGYIGTEIRNQLNWGKGSVFSKFIDPRSTIRQNLCILEAKSREYGEFSELDEIKGKIEGVSSTYGVNIFGNINNRLVLKTSNALSAIEVFEDDKPLNQRGFGSKKLLNLGLQIDGNEASTVVLIDEIEIGLEPYRIRSLIRKFVNETKNRGQLIFTTHSPIALVEMNINQVLVVHSEDGKTEIVKAETGEASVDHKLQGMLRKYTEAFLSPKVVICEGKTEVGFLRAMDEWLFAKKDFYVASKGVSFVDGDGGGSAPRLAKQMHNLGYKVCVFCDNDRTEEDKEKADLETLGVHIFQWDKGNCIETELIPVLLKMGNYDALKIDSNKKESLWNDLIAQQIALSKYEIKEYLSDVEISNTAAVCKKNEMFKNIDGGEKLGTIWFDNYDNISKDELAIKTLEAMQTWMMV